MKKLIAALFLFFVLLVAQNTPNNNYYPLKEGNSWVYLSEGHRTEIIGGASFVLHWYSPLVVEVVSDTVINSNTVWKLRYMSYTYNFSKYDTSYTYQMFSSTGDSLYMDYYANFNPSNDNLRFVFDSNIGETIFVKFFDYRLIEEMINIKYTSKNSDNIFGVSTDVMNFAFQNVSVKYTQKFGEGLGLIEQYGKGSDNSWESRINLQGCVIDGVVYGDTSLIVSVNDEDDLPTKLSLSQNYPNPFNPSTKIKFNIPNVGDAYYASPTNITLIVYDILGREVATLLNKPMQAGKYEVEFDGSDLPNGVYFYRLIAGNFIQTRKMILIK